MKPLRICVFARAMPKHRPYYPVPAAMIAKALIKLGHEVVVLTTSLPDGSALYQNDGGMTVNYLKGTSPGVLDNVFYSRSAKFFDDLYSSSRFDLIIGRGKSTWGYFDQSRYAGQVPVISHEGTYPLWLHQLQRRAGPFKNVLAFLLAPVFASLDRKYRVCMQKSAWVVCNSPALAKAFMRAYWWKPPRTKFIPYGFDASPYKRAHLKGVFRDPPKIVYVGRVTWDKGALAMVDIISKVQRKDVILEIIGPVSKKVETRLIKHAKNMGVLERIVMTGPEFNSNIPERLAGASAFLFPSTHPEGLSKSVMEAMAAGIPVVSYRLPGIETLVDDGVTGWLVPSRCTDCAAQKLDDLLGDADKVVKMGAAGRRKIEEEFATAPILARWRKLLEHAA